MLQDLDSIVMYFQNLVCIKRYHSDVNYAIAIHKSRFKEKERSHIIFIHTQLSTVYSNPCK